MKFYKKMDSTERDILILKAVQGSVALEGMSKAAEECRIEISRLQAKQKKRVRGALKSKDQKD
ncbi:MAG: hypothetical protein JEZ02_00010 [Desulfatibacillum sp.]|nr:hypothetical protein [Desulfatibacillum sp.]